MPPGVNENWTIRRKNTKGRNSIAFYVDQKAREKERLQNFLKMDERSFGIRLGSTPFRDCRISSGYIIETITLLVPTV